jgi:hypothetical protein
MLAALWRSINYQDSDGRRHGIDDPDNDFLRDRGSMGSAHRQEETPGQCKRQSIPVRCLALNRVTGKKRDRDSQSGYLGKGQINEDDASGQDVETQVDVDTRKNQAGQKRQPEKLDG